MFKLSSMSNRRLVVLPGLLAFLCGMVGIVNAGSVNTRPYPNNPALRVDYSPDINADKSCGSMVVTVSSQTGPSLIDRHLEIVLYVGSNFSRSIVYRTKVTLPQGATTATTQLYYNQPFENYVSWKFDVLESGQSVAFPKPHINYSSTRSQNGTPQRMCCEIVEPSGSRAEGFSYDYAQDGLVVDQLARNDAPDDWRLYFNYIFVAWPLGQLEEATDAQKKSLSTYLSSGGSVFIYFVDDESLAKIDRWLNSGFLGDEPDPRWAELNENGKRCGYQRPHGGGKIFALISNSNDLHSFVRTTTHYQIGGVIKSNTADIEWFWKNLVQTVGKTPVWAFTGFVLLFVLLVGPGLLYFTGRLRQRTLMLLLVPALSGILTTCILIYNVVREGFVTRGRIASLQYFDVPSKQGFAWSRQTYFSGAPPRDGLKFSPDTLLKPFNAIDNYNSYVNDPSKIVLGEVVTDDKSRWLQKWLAPRTQMQLMAGQPLSKFTLPIKVEGVAEGRIRVTNLTADPLPIVLLRGTGEHYYWVDELAANDTREVVSKSLGEVEVDYVRESHKWIPEGPAEVNVYRRYRPQYYYGTSTQFDCDPLDSVIRSKTYIPSLAEFGFLIFSHQSSDLELPLAADVYEPEHHFHVLSGVAPW